MSQEERCVSVAGLSLVPEMSAVEVRCSLINDHFEYHALLHDDIVLLTWGIDDDGVGVITGGVFAPLFRDQI